jgi:hypothetical protein
MCSPESPGRAFYENTSRSGSSGAFQGGSFGGSLCTSTGRAYTAPMTEQPSAGAPEASPGDPNAECPHCLKPQALCVCEGITRINNEVSLLILQHPQDASQCESKSSLVP